MKRAKIMLSALAVLAVVGSALAFKASKTFSGNLRCAETTTTTTICPLLTYSTTTITSPGTTMACTARNAGAGAVCTTAFVTRAD